MGPWGGCFQLPATNPQDPAASSMRACELLESPSELLESPSELLESPSELLESPSELLASPSELLAALERTRQCERAAASEALALVTEAAAGCGGDDSRTWIAQQFPALLDAVEGAVGPAAAAAVDVDVELRAAALAMLVAAAGVEVRHPPPSSSPLYGWENA
jgi:hypothetical protein